MKLFKKLRRRINDVVLKIKNSFTESETLLNNTNAEMEIEDSTYIRESLLMYDDTYN